MGDENYGLALCLELVHLVAALFLEGFIAYGEDFVYKEGVRVGVDGCGKTQPQVHAGGEIFQLHVFEFLELGEVEDFVVYPVHLFSAQAQDGGVNVNVFLSCKFRLKANTQLEEGGDLAVQANRAAVRV